MREFQDKKKLRKYLFSKATVIVLFIAILFTAKAAWGVYKKERESAANVLRSQNYLAKLEERQNTLSGELSRLGTDEGMEEEIRSKYGVSKPGEEFLVIVDKDKPTTTPIQEDESWWNKFKNIFR